MSYPAIIGSLNEHQGADTNRILESN